MWRKRFGAVAVVGAACVVGALAAAWLDGPAPVRPAPEPRGFSEAERMLLDGVLLLKSGDLERAAPRLREVMRMGLDPEFVDWAVGMLDERDLINLIALGGQGASITRAEMVRGQDEPHRSIRDATASMGGAILTRR